MGKNLPNVYAVPITKKITNNKDSFQSREEETKISPISLEEINKIFNSKTHVYKTKVVVKTKKETKEADIIGRTNQALLTLNGEKIPLDEIYEIKKV